MVNPLLGRRRFLISTAVVAIGVFGCSPAQPELSATDIVKKSSDALKTVKSAHFKLSSTGGMMAIGTGLLAKSIEGDVVQPDRLKGTATSTFGKITVEISFISVGGQQFITNPITKKWEKLPGSQASPNLLDPDKGAPKLLTQAQNLKKVANESIDGVDCYHVTGDVPSSLVAGLIGAQGNDTALSGEIWIGTTDFLPRKIHLTGKVTPDEPPQIERVLELANFNESIQIDPPT
jgi:hypothetical protein